jgi:Domain of unknown function (DUF4136)
MRTLTTPLVSSLMRRVRSLDARGARAALSALVALGLPLAAACYPDQLTSAADVRTVTTLFDTSAAFGTLHTYSLVDSVVTFPKDSTPVPKALSDAVIAEIRTQLGAKGWTEIKQPSTTQPDMYVVAGVNKSTYVFFDWYTYWGWWGYWPYPPGWGWTAPVVYSYEVGTMLVAMTDGKRAQPKGIPVDWIAAVRGVSEGQVTNQQVAVAGVEQAFKQSPYLQVGPAVSPIGDRGRTRGSP